MKKLIVNADDFGYREGINKGIVFAHQSGVVTSVSLFVEKEGTEEAVRLAKENPGLGMGPHLDLDKFFNIDHHFGIVLEMNSPHPGADALRSEIKRQMDKFFSFGFTADHLDSHHHSHLHPEVFPIVCDIAKEYKVPVVRLFSKFYSDHQVYENMKNLLHEKGLVFIDHFIEGWYWGNVDESYQIAELMTHPGYAELWREAELAHCCQPQLKQYLIDQKIDLLRFSDIAGK